MGEVMHWTRLSVVMKDVLLLLQLDLFQCMCCMHSY